jgi:CrcB protein
MQKTILIGLAGFVGTVGRYWLSDAIARQHGEAFPWGTVVVNLIGCFLVGCFYYATEERFALSPSWRSVILIGLLGGFTTFSSYGLQTFVLLREGQIVWASLNVAISNGVGLLMVWAGYSITKIL